MKLAILETGKPPAALGERFGDYPAMFERLLGPEFEYESFDVASGGLPAERQAHDAFLITGSPAGVYDKLAWIAPLMDFVRGASDRKMVGICFGNQLMAEALGGHVEKSDKGWGAGLHLYSIERVQSWMDPVGEVAVPASHQDQVVSQPPNTQITAGSEFTPFAALAWTDRPAISFQFHPEFAPEYAKALIAERYDVVSNPEAAIASLDRPNDSDRIAGWIRNFLKGDRL